MCSYLSPHVGKMQYNSWIYNIKLLKNSIFIISILLPIFIVLLLPHPPFFKQQKLVWSFSTVVALPDFFFKCRWHLEWSILIQTFDYALRISPISKTVSCEKNEKHKKIPSINSGPVNFKKYKTLDSVETNPSVYSHSLLWSI